MPIAELFLGAFLQVLLDRLASHELLHFARHKGIETLLKEWEKKLISINQVLDDAEDRQLTDDRGVKSWLEDLRNLAYDIEDLLDEFTIESAKNRPKAEPSTSEARFLLPSCCFNLSPRAFMFDCKMRSKMKEMDDKLKDVITQKNNLKLKKDSGQQSTYHPPNLPFPTTHLTEEFFIGRENEKMKILKLLTREEDDRTCKLIPIVGMPGLGKTALAQQVYNDDRVTDYFDVKAWVCVSADFDLFSITRSILETTRRHLLEVKAWACISNDSDFLSITGSTLETTRCRLPDEPKTLEGLRDELKNCLLGKKFLCRLPDEPKTMEGLQDELKNYLSDRKFLVVLDDVWKMTYENWTLLLRPFQSGAKGSKIIITTRDFGVASLVKAPPITLEVLSLDDCMTLFASHAPKNENFDHSDFEVLSQKIVEKCQGLPLAVKALAGLLRTIDSPHYWEDILNNKIWDKPEINILPTLKLSYLHLYSNLRRCFAYCAIFPKDYEIRQNELIHWWIAEGLVEGKDAKNQWNEGVSYFRELVNRSLFLKSSSDGSRFLMHDIVNDLAKLVAGATYFDLGEFKGDHNNASLARHASFTPNKYIRPKKFEIYRRMKRLRSFISLDKPSRIDNMVFVSQKVLCDLLLALKYLRVLSLSHYQITEVPESIGKLRHLRHLNLSYTNIETLPKSIGALYNLEALMLQGCKFLLKLPKGIKKLIKLRFLDIRDTSNLEMMPPYIGELVGLEMLSKFVVGTGNGSRLKELKDLENLGGELCIFDLHMVQEARDAIDANLCTKKGICRLTLQWSIDFENSRNEELEGEVLNFLRPHRNLKNLTISYYGGLEFPSWLGSPSHVNLVCLHLHECRVKALPSLGHLPSLKELYIEGLNAICMVGSEFYGSRSPFPSLLTLEFKGMPLWKYWSHCIDTEEVGVVFPRLEHLVIQDCPMLIGRLPSQLSSLVELTINSCSHMEASSSFNSLPSLNELRFKGCNERVLHNLVNLASLTTLNINDVTELICLNHWFTSSLIKLEKLEIENCTKLIYLWQDGDVIRNLNCLKRLVVCSCPELIYFVAEEGDIELPGNLETTELIKCVNVEKLPSKMHTLSSLRDLVVKDCPKLVSFPEIGIPTSLISLSIAKCQMLQSLPKGLSPHLDEPSSRSSNTRSDIISSLQDLRIFRCNNLPSSPLSEGIFLPTTLKRLEIRSCRGVKSLAEMNLEPLQSIQEIKIRDLENLISLPQGLHTLSRLTSLKLHGCPGLEMECFPPLPPSISEFHLWECPKIKSLPNQFHQLTSLQDLRICGCESITRLPEGGLPPQLKSLWIVQCESMEQPVGEWLTPLTFLEMLYIDGSIGGVGEEKDLVLPLPSSLLHLNIVDIGKMERLSRSLPPSLQELWIQNCPKVRELPQDGLPPSLENLFFNNCPILEKRCKKGTGCYWPLIREIPNIDIR